MNTYCKYGTHRVIEPLGVLPQAALRIDPNPVCYDNEVLIDVDTLNIDSASFRQIKEACGHNKDQMKQMIMDIVKRQGKMQNPVTKSGGMLLGTVREVGSRHHDSSLKPGVKIATLVSLSLTPLTIKTIHDINLDNDQVHIEGQAILFDSGVYAVIPDDLDEKVALAALDVCGAPAQVKALCKPGDIVVILGAAGKSGLLCAYQAMKEVGPKGRIISVARRKEQTDMLLEMGLCHETIIADATNALQVYHEVEKRTNGRLADLTINVVNVENTEMSSVLATRDQGIVYFFSMATSFTKAALGAEGIGKDVTMIIGNGYTKDHARITLDILRESKTLMELFDQRYA